ncbi:MAG: decarboxylating 6-phosphogluconate dehydrogenase [Bifidobacteriaceae bacterium]|jgi:6-phosphogluconate dehydrogenase|nr:decarboxylating 6-phosphogluconate dehydrogenase [Bifidobacteriaceae bacterium]
MADDTDKETKVSTGTTTKVMGDQIRIVVFMGVSGSGKTTAGALTAGRLGWDFAEADDFHPQANIAKMSSGVPLTDEDRLPWLQDLRKWIDSAIAEGKRGVMTCSALKRSYRDLLRAPGVVFAHMAGSQKTVESRLGARQGHFMPATLLASQYHDLEEFGPDEDYVSVDLDLGLTPSQEVDMVMAALGLAGQTNMTMGLVGLGKMGGNMAARLRDRGVGVVGFDVDPKSGRDVESLQELVASLAAPRVVWTMVPAGGPTAKLIEELQDLLEPGDLVIDGGNSPYRDDAGHAARLAEREIHFVDAGVSGGVWGRENGYALMVGGAAEDVDLAMPIFNALTPEGGGFVHAGPVGAGHYTKMVHNGIEYGMMQALGEGYDMLGASRLVTDPDAVVASWREGTVVRSWLLDLLVEALEQNPGLAGYAAQANDSGEARWMIESALDLGVPLPVTAASLYARQTSKRPDNPAIRVVSALRAQFGGHPVART